MSIAGAACGLKAVGQRHIEFVVPQGVSSSEDGTPLPLTINNNGVVLRGWVTIIPTRPDIFRSDGVVAPLGRAKLFNVTNTVFRTEPFAVRTIRRRGNMFVPTVLRLYLTGVEQAPASVIKIRIRDQVIEGGSIKSDATLIDPGIYTIDFELPAALDGAGDQPIVVLITVGNTTYTSRLDDTSTRVRIL